MYGVSNCWLRLEETQVVSPHFNSSEKQSTISEEEGENSTAESGIWKARKKHRAVFTGWVPGEHKAPKQPHLLGSRVRSGSTSLDIAPCLWWDARATSRSEKKWY